MANYSFTVEDGKERSFSINVFGLVPGMAVRPYIYDSSKWLDWVDVDIQTSTNVISVTIPASAATSETLPTRYKINVSADGWATTTTAVRGQIYFLAAQPDDPGAGPPDVDRGEPGGVAALDADGDVIDADQNKVMPIIVLNPGDPVPPGLRSNTLIVELAT